MNKLIETSDLQSAFSARKALSGSRAISLLAALNIQRVITVSALLLLLAAVQVSTQSIADWYVFDLNVLEMTTPATPVLTEVSHVATDLNLDMGTGIVSGLGTGVNTGLVTDLDTGNFLTDIGIFTQKLIIGIIECALD